MTEPGGKSIDEMAAEPDQFDAAFADADAFAGVLTRNWEGALLVARSCENAGRGRPPLNVENRHLAKLTMVEFAERAGVHRTTVAKYLAAWNLAAADDLVPPADELVPGQQVDLSALTAEHFDAFYNGRMVRPAVETPPAPLGQYRCVVIDPPWPVQKILRQVRPNQTQALDYPTLQVEEIEALIADRLDGRWDDCQVYLWVTHKYLPAGLDLLRAWGVKYQCVLTWVKNVGPTPFSWMYDTEHVLFGPRGSAPLLQKGLRLSFSAAAVGHSVKPDVFYDRVRAVSDGPRLEMFARAPHEGFEPWGAEAVV